VRTIFSLRELTQYLSIFYL